MRSSLFIIVLLCCSLFSSMAFGHKVRIFAYGEGESIVGETAFSGGRKPKNADIIVANAKDGAVLHKTVTDETGNFSFTIPDEARDNSLDLMISIEVGEGHRGEWLLEAAEYLTDSSPQPVNETTTPPSPVITSTQPKSNDVVLSVPPLNNEQLKILVEEAVEKQLRPVKQMLAANREQQISLQDILGGIGYLFGLAGIAAYMQAKKRK